MISFDVTRRVNNPRYRSISPIPLYDKNIFSNRRNIVKDNKRNQIVYRPRSYPLRKVPAFTIQTEQQNTRPFTPINDPIACHRRHIEKYLLCRIPPPKTDENLRKFQRLYEDRRFPIRLTIGPRGQRCIEWLVDPSQLGAHDRREIFRRFAVGLPVEREPYTLIAVQGFSNLLDTPNAEVIVAEFLAEIVPNIRKGLNSSKTWKKLEMLKLIDKMVQLPGIGLLLVPYYRMLLPPLRIVNATRITTDITISERDRLRVAIDETLKCLEKYGGPDALLNIKYLIPEYHSHYQSTIK